MLSSLFSKIFADEEPADDKEAPKAEEATQAKTEETSTEAVEEEAEAEEPEDPHPAIQEECGETSKCVPLRTHFQHCQDKVNGGEGYKHEDCVEEMQVYVCFACMCIYSRYLLFSGCVSFLPTVHYMHCVDNCAAPKLFSKLV